MTQPLQYETNDPLSMVVDYLEKCNEDKLASDLIDVFAARTDSIEQINLLAKLYLDVRNISKAEQFALRVLGKAGTNQETYNARANLGKLYNNINEHLKNIKSDIKVI